MADIENAIKGLEWILEDDRFGFGQGLTNPECEEEQAGCFIRDTIELLKEQPHWIPTMEKMPNAFETVLFADNVEISMGWYDNRNNKFYVVDSILEENVRENTVDDAPLYWMPLPKLPRDCENDG